MAVLGTALPAETNAVGKSNNATLIAQHVAHRQDEQHCTKNAACVMMLRIKKVQTEQRSIGLTPTAGCMPDDAAHDKGSDRTAKQAA